jgi:multiple sugar transport system substrate-binding protein
MFDRGHWELVGLRSNPEYTGDNFFVVPQPAKENGDTVIYESGFIIKNGLEGEQLKAACKFVEQLTSRKYQDTKAITGIAISANREAAEAAADAAEDPELERAFLAQVENARLPYGALYAKWPTIEQILDGMMEQILNGTTVQEAVDDAVTEINRELSQ